MLSQLLACCADVIGGMSAFPSIRRYRIDGLRSPVANLYQLLHTLRDVACMLSLAIDSLCDLARDLVNLCNRLSD